MTLSEKLNNFRRIAKEHGRLPLELEAAEALLDVALAACLPWSDMELIASLTELQDKLERLDKAIG